MPLASELLQQTGRAGVFYRGKRFIYFGGCDYFRLSSHPLVRTALRRTLKESGLTVAASRATTGDHPLYHRLESHLARFFKVGRALLLPTGYSANLAVGEALSRRRALWFLDDKAHPSLRTAAALSGAYHLFPHGDSRALAGQVARAGRRRLVVVATEGVFGLSGEIAPVLDYLAVLPATGLLLVDDAHAAGILGKQGRGSVEFHGLKDRRVVQTITLSKAFGVYGGAVLGAASFVEEIAKTSCFLGGTPLPLPVTAAALTALEVFESSPRLRQALLANIHLASALLKPGQPPGATPIFSWPVRDLASAERQRRRLLRHGIFPTFIRYPGGPPNGLFRFAITARHTRAEIERLAEALD